MNRKINVLQMMLTIGTNSSRRGFTHGNEKHGWNMTHNKGVQPIYMAKPFQKQSKNTANNTAG